jgi:predicted dehydrogenase
MTDTGIVRLGFIGSGGNARHHMGQVLKLEEFQIVAINDPNPAMLQAAKRQYPTLADVPTFDDYRKMLDTVEMDAVEISTPHTLHYEQIVASLEKGLHVLCEKPLVCTVAHAKDVIHRLQKSGKVGLVSYQRHYQPEFLYIRQKIASGDFGKVQFVSALQCQNWKRSQAGTWRQDPALSGGGQLNDSGSHLLDIILWVTGLSVESVSAFIDNLGTPVDINSALSLKFRGGALGNISIVGDSPDWHEDITIWCENGIFFMRNGKLQVCDGAANRYSFDQMRGGSFPDKNFLDAIKGRDTVQAPFTCGLRVIELTEAAWKSAAKGGIPVQVEAV